MRSLRRLGGFLVIAAALGPAACSTYSDALSRGQRAFEQSEHERALSIFRALEPDIYRLPVDERAHYAYLRGMTDYRIGYKAEARHWLSIADALERQRPDSLPTDWSKRMAEALHDLNDLVYAGGVASLSNTPSATRKAGEDEGDDEAPAATPRPKPDGE